MLQIINPRPFPLNHDGASQDRNIGIVVKCWENAKPLIKELEQTVNFAERKCGDLMQQLNFCKEYYEKYSTERTASTAVYHRKKSRNKSNRRSEECRKSSENESEELLAKQINNDFNERLRNKICEITNEIKEANRRIILKEATFITNQKINNESEVDVKKEIGNKSPMSNCTIKSESNTKSRNEDDLKRSAQTLKKVPSKILSTKKSPAIGKRYTTVQKYKLRSKSLPQGVRRKFGFGSFVEIVDRPKHTNLLKIKSKTSVSGGSKINLERGRAKTRTLSGHKPRQRNRSRSVKLIFDKTESSKNMGCLGDGDTYTVVSNTQNAPNKSLSNFSTDFGSSQMKLCATCLPEENLDIKKKSMIIARRQPIPFTICRTAKTFNLGLNIQQVLSMIKNKRHSTMLQTILKNNIRTARSVIQKTEPINSLYIATPSRMGRITETESCPARDNDHCYSVISADTTEGSLKCNLLTCRQSVREEFMESVQSGTDPPFPLVRQIKISELQRPEDVWVVEQPDSHHSLQRFRSRCTCYPSRGCVEYQKVLKQYSRMKQCEQKAICSSDNFVSRDFSTGFVMSGSDLYSLPSQTRYHDKIRGPRLEFKRVHEDLDNLTRRFESIQERLMEHRPNDFQVDAELDALELDFNYREEDCKIILNFYNQLLTLKRKIQSLRGRIRSSTNVGEDTSKPPRSRKDPFRPTPSMTLTKVLRQIQCLQNKIKLIDSPCVI